MTLKPRSPFLILAAAGMEICWLYGFLLLTHHRGCDQCLFIPGIMSLFPLAFLFQRFVHQSVGSKAGLRAITWLGWIVASIVFTELATDGGSGFLNTRWGFALLGRIFSFAAFPTPDLLTAASAALFWGCGKRLAGMDGRDNLALSEFQFGVFMLLILFFLDAQWSMDLEGLLPLTLVFFLFALMGLPMALLHGGPGWSSTERRVRWLGVVLGGVCLVLAAGLLAAFILKPELLSLLWSIVKAIGRFIALWISKIISFLASYLPEPDAHRPMPALPSPAETDPSFIAKMFNIPEGVRKVMRLVVGAIWVVLILGALWSLSAALFQWFLQRVARAEGAEVETLSGAFREHLLFLLRVLIRRMKRLGDLVLRILGIRTGGRTPPPGPTSAREIYRRLLRWAAGKGFPRNKTQTPGEYLDVLVKRLPGGCSEFSFITARYVEERYSPRLTSTDTLEQVHANWQKLKRSKARKLRSG